MGLNVLFLMVLLMVWTLMWILLIPICGIEGNTEMMLSD